MQGRGRMGPRVARSFRVLLAGSVMAVVFGLLGGLALSVFAFGGSLESPGWAAFAGALGAIALLTPLAMAHLTGACPRSLVAGYACALLCVAFVLVLGIVYMPLVPWAPTLVAGASVAGLRYFERNEE